MKRAQNKVRRILTLIDALAPLRMPFTVQQAKVHLENKGGDCVGDRTVLRDLELLVSMNFAEVHRESYRGSKEPAQYKMNLRMTTNAEVAAIKATERKP